MVASSLLPDRVRNPVAWASHLALFARRLPGAPANEAALYGVSYARELFERFGPFNETMRIGEDSEFNARVASAGKPVWVPAACTIHRAPTSLPVFLFEQYNRGRRAGEHILGTGRVLRRQELRTILKVRMSLSRRMAKIAVPAEHQKVVARASGLIAMAHLTYVGGVARGNRVRLLEVTGRR